MATMAIDDSTVSATMTEEENLNPNTTTSYNSNRLENHFPTTITALRGGEEEVPSKEKKILRGRNDYATRISAAAINHTHSLENTWTFWFDNPVSKSNQDTWGSSLRSLYTFASIQEFWSLYNNMHPPTKCAPGADLYCFKHGIEPKWEDPVCVNGGKWTMMFPKAKLESNWLNTQGDEVCGAVLNFRTRGDKVSIWTKNAANEEAQLSIGKQWKELLGYNETMGFIVHEDAKTLDRDAKHRYTV